MTTLLDRLLGRETPDSTAVKELRTALYELQASTNELSRKLDADPCASDPTREECGPELARELHNRGDPAKALRIARLRRET